MPSTHTNLLTHVIFSTKNREPNLLKPYRSRVYEYMGGIVRNLSGVSLEIGGTADHVHMLLLLRPTHALSSVMRDVKGDSSRWFHEEFRMGFEWQEGYGAFSVSQSNVETVREYIRTQEEHHRTRTFKEEYLRFLASNGVAFDERFLW